MMLARRYRVLFGKFSRHTCILVADRRPGVGEFVTDTKKGPHSVQSFPCVVD